MSKRSRTNSCLLNSLALYHKSLFQMKNGEYCFRRIKGPKGTWWSITIAGTELTSIADSEEIWAFCHSKLEILNLTRNRLETLPNQLVAFRNSLELLCASYNCFTRVPEVVFELSSLLHLNLVGNQISRLPPDIRVLSQLTSLFLGNNKLRSLPDVFDDLKELREVGFDDNYLSELPPSFTSLTKLKRVELGHNQFTQISDELFDLEQLQSLHIEHNRIQRVSPRIRNLLSGLKSLKLVGNPLQHPAFLECSDSEIITLLRKSLSEPSGTKFRPSLRILVLGICGSGKTSVVTAFHKHKYVTQVAYSEHDHTVGIDRYRIPFDMGGEVQEIVLWDFAGEEDAAIINEMFQSEHTLIWHVVNLADYEEGSDISYREHVGDPLDSLLTRICKPVVWIVATHADLLEADEVERKCFEIKRHVKDDCEASASSIEERLEEIAQQLNDSTLDLPSRSSLEDSRKHYHTLQAAGPMYMLKRLKVLPLTNTHSFKGFDILKSNLQELPLDDAFDFLNSPLPDTWVTAARAINRCGNELLAREKPKPPIVYLREAHAIIQDSISERSERQSALEYLHQNGEILFLSRDSGNAGTMVVLDVPWLIDILKCVFRHGFDDSVWKNYYIYSLPRDTLKSALDEKQSRGIVKAKLLRALWLVEDVRDKEAFVAIVSLLTKFRLAYETTAGDYLFPWFLPTEDPAQHSLSVNPVQKESRHITVRYSFAHRCKLECLFALFTVHCLECVPAFDSIFRNSVEATIGTMHLRATYGREKVELHITQDLCHGTGTYEELWKVLMQLVRGLECLLQEWKGRWIDRFVLCPTCVEAQEAEPHLFPLECKRPGPQFLEQRCHICAARPGTSGEVAKEMIVPPVEFMLGVTNKSAKCPLAVQSSDCYICAHSLSYGNHANITTHHLQTVLERLKNCYESITREDCVKVNNKVEMVKAEWPRFLAGLKWTRAAIGEVEHQLPTERCFYVLYQWTRSTGRDATVAALTKAVLDTNTVDQWKEVLLYFHKKYVICNSMELT